MKQYAEKVINDTYHEIDRIEAEITKIADTLMEINCIDAAKELNAVVARLRVGSFRKCLAAYNEENERMV